MLTSQKYDMLGILDLKSHEQADCFQRVESLVDVVSQKYIFVTLHLLFVRKSEILEKSEKVMETTVYTSKNLDRRTNTHKARFCFHKLDRFLT